MDSEHELLIFQRVQGALGWIHSADCMNVQSIGSLADALGQLGCFPYAEIPCDSFSLDYEFSVGGKPAGTFEKPDVDLILKESTASSFGKGEKTVLDPTYRNGKEIPAENMKISDQYFKRNSEDEISAAMFVGKTVKLKFYKLAIYEEGGHFDWHMDTTHSDKHHATLLLALNTSWEGGEFKLRRNGVETSVNMHPKADRKGKGINLQAVAFYTDTEHKVEAVTKGIRIVLQYDVEVVGWVDKPVGRDKDKDEDPEEEENVIDHDEDDEDKRLFEDVENISRKRKRHEESSDSLVADDANLTKVTDIIARSLANGEVEVAFAMQHLYRKSSILPEYLKGADAQLYRALTQTFDVTLRPVVLQATTDYEGRCETYLALPWPRESAVGSAGSDTDLGSESEDEDKAEGEDKDDDKNKGEDESEDDDCDSPRCTVFHLPMLSAIEQLSYQSYIEYTGNSAQPGETKYFGGGMFVRQKKAALEG